MIMRSLFKNAVIPLAIGALSAALLISCYAMFWYEIPAGGEPRWVVVPSNFMKVFPLMLMSTSVIFLLVGPVFYVLLRKLQLFTWWGTTVAGGFVAFALVLLLHGEFSVLVQPFYFLVGACSALLSFLSHKHSNKPFDQSAGNSGGASR